MGDIVLGTPGKTVLSESGGSVSWGTGAPTGTMIQIVDNPITSVITRMISKHLFTMILRIMEKFMIIVMICQLLYY